MPMQNIKDGLLSVTFLLDEVPYSVNLNHNKEPNKETFTTELQAGEKKVLLKKSITLPIDGQAPHPQYEISGEGSEMSTDAQCRGFLASWMSVVISQVYLRQQDEDDEVSDQIFSSVNNLMQLFNHFFAASIISLMMIPDGDLDENDTDDEEDMNQSRQPRSQSTPPGWRPTENDDQGENDNTYDRREGDN